MARGGLGPIRHRHANKPMVEHTSQCGHGTMQRWGGWTADRRWGQEDEGEAICAWKENAANIAAVPFHPQPPKPVPPKIININKRDNYC